MRLGWKILIGSGVLATIFVAINVASLRSPLISGLGGRLGDMRDMFRARVRELSVGTDASTFEQRLSGQGFTPFSRLENPKLYMIDKDAETTRLLESDEHKMVLVRSTLACKYRWLVGWQTQESKVSRIDAGVDAICL